MNASQQKLMAEIVAGQPPLSFFAVCQPLVDSLAAIIKELAAKAQAADDIVAIMIADDDWNSDTLDACFDALHRRKLIEVTRDGYACPKGGDQ